jgi:hypothetical protein
MYKNPTDYFMHLTSDPSTSEILAKAYREQVCPLPQPCACSPLQQGTRFGVSRQGGQARVCRIPPWCVCLFGGGGILVGVCLSCVCMGLGGHPCRSVSAASHDATRLCACSLRRMHLRPAARGQ